MKVGILILAHSDLDQLKRLVDILKRDFTIFIHLDKRWKISPDVFMGEENVYVIKKHKVYWGSYNQILATLDLLKMVDEQHCDYCMLISGKDLPIRPNREIIAEIEKDPQINYLVCHLLPSADWLLNGGLDRMQLYWENFKNQYSASLCNRFCGLCRRIQKLLHLRRKLLPGISYYGGRNWLNLSGETVSYVVQYIEEHPEFLRSFRYTRTADEVWLQTVVMNSPYKEKTISDSKRYVDWRRGPEFPRTLRLDNYEEIVQSDAFFARKFDPNTDNEIIEKVYELQRKK
jgi:hypothetical protein